MKIGIKSRMMLPCLKLGRAQLSTFWSGAEAAGAALISVLAFLISCRDSELHFQTGISCRSLTWTENKCAMQVTVTGCCPCTPSLSAVAFGGFAGYLPRWSLLGWLTAKKRSRRLVPAHRDDAVCASMFGDPAPSFSRVWLSLTSTGAGVPR